MVEKGMACIKYLLFAFNLIFFIFGAVLIGVGAYVQIKLAEYVQFSGNLNGAAILVIIVGVVTFIVGFFGCCGAIKENHCMVMTFAVLIGIILICELAAGIAGYVLQNQIEGLLKEGMKTALKGYNTSDTGVTQSWDKIQKELKCCGINDASDWTGIASFKGDEVPDSCCQPAGPCTKTDVKNQGTKGCLTELEDVLKSNIGIVAGAGIGLAVIELTGIILACCLARSIRSEYEVA